MMEYIRMTKQRYEQRCKKEGRKAIDFAYYKLIAFLYFMIC